MASMNPADRKRRRENLRTIYFLVLMTLCALILIAMVLWAVGLFFPFLWLHSTPGR